MRTPAPAATRTVRLPARRVAALLLAAGQVLAAGHALAQCPSQALHELGGAPGPAFGTGGTFLAQTSVVAIARGRFISFETSPLVSGSPQVLSRVALDHPAVAMHSEFTNRLWATDGTTIYGINCNDAAVASLLGKVNIPGAFYIERLRVKGNFVYATDNRKIFVVDITNPAAPVLRSTYTAPSGTWMNDLEIVGSYAYVAIEEFPNQVNHLMVLDVSNPLSLTQVTRRGNSGREAFRISKAPNLSGLYTLSRNSTAGALELWSITSPTNPTLLSVNATLNIDVFYDELRATNTGIVRWDDDNRTVRIYNTSTLAQFTSTLPYSSNVGWVQGLGTDVPYIFLTKNNGETARLRYDSSGVTGITDPFMNVVPGYTQSIHNNGEGYSILTGLGNIWHFSAPVGGAPTPRAHIKPDPNFGSLGAHGALMPGGVFFTVQYPASPAAFTRLLAYQADASGITYRGFLDISGTVYGLAAGLDAGGIRRVFATTGFGNSTLHVINASNLASMSVTSTFALAPDIYTPVRFLPAATGQPPRVIVGGTRAQIVSVATPNFPANLGVIPSAASRIIQGAGNLVWTLDRHLVRAHDITNPVVPVLVSETYVDEIYSYADALITTNAARTALAATNSRGQLVRIDAADPASPTITHIAKASSAINFGSLNAAAFDGVNFHFAAGNDGYTVYPPTFSSPPSENLNRALRRAGTQGIVGICPGQNLVLTASFVANPAITGYQWKRYNRTTFAYEPIANGPTGTGSQVFGATSPVLTIVNPGTDDATYYLCEATNTCGTTSSGAVQTRVGGYANCDGSTVPPVLNALDFNCFLAKYREESPSGWAFDYSNCDGSTVSPILNALDFNCFLTKYRQGCQ